MLAYLKYCLERGKQVVQKKKAVALTPPVVNWVPSPSCDFPGLEAHPVGSRWAFLYTVVDPLKFSEALVKLRLEHEHLLREWEKLLKETPPPSPRPCFLVKFLVPLRGRVTIQVKCLKECWSKGKPWFTKYMAARPLPLETTGGHQDLYCGSHLLLLHDVGLPLTPELWHQEGVREAFVEFCVGDLQQMVADGVVHGDLRPANLCYSPLPRSSSSLASPTFSSSTFSTHTLSPLSALQ